MTERNVFTEAQETWLKALESGKWKQCREALRDVEEGTEDFTYCCLGVANVVCGLKETNSETLEHSFGLLNLRSSQGRFRNALPIDDDDPEIFHCDLTEVNDSGDWDFARIAAFIRANPWQVFTNFDAPVQP